MAISLDIPILGEANGSYSVKRVQAGAAVTYCQPVYMASDLKYYPAINTAIPTANVAGLAVTQAAADEDYFLMWIAGELAINDGTGTSMTIGTSYCLGGASGEIEAYSAVGAAEYVTYLGLAVTVRVLDVKINPTGVVHG